MRTLICLLAAAACACAADVTGKWTGTAEIANPSGETQRIPITFQLRQSEAKLTGALVSDDQETQITSGKVDGAAVSFHVKPGENDPDWSVTLTADGDDLNGTGTAEQAGATLKAKVTLKRAPPA